MKGEDKTRPVARKKLDLRTAPTLTRDTKYSDAECDALLLEKSARIADLQRRLIAGGRDALLVVFEGVDAAGKDGAIRRIFRQCDPQGCRTVSFQAPAGDAAQHDFLWRFNRHLPRRGEIAVFNRSHYGDVVVPRVHPTLLDARKGPLKRGKKLWAGRYRSIVDWEAHLVRSGIRIAKIFLHVSADEQRDRLLERIDRADKNWKVEREDICDHHRHADYLRWYEECIRRTHTDDAPWFLVAADDKPHARLAAADIVLRQLEAIDPHYPKTSKKRARELSALRAALLDASAAREQCHAG